MKKIPSPHGIDAIFVEVKDGGHGNVLQMIMPQIFDFFDQHQRC